jgi:ribose 5-phosphate isomerase
MCSLAIMKARHNRCIKGETTVYNAEKLLDKWSNSSSRIVKESTSVRKLTNTTVQGVR